MEMMKLIMCSIYTIVAIHLHIRINIDSHNTISYTMAVCDGGDLIMWLVHNVAGP